jgi:hypothetical protein
VNANDHPDGLYQLFVFLLGRQFWFVESDLGVAIKHHWLMKPYHAQAKHQALDRY